jgi:hypothetical protein
MHLAETAESSDLANHRRLNIVIRHRCVVMLPSSDAIFG